MSRKIGFVHFTDVHFGMRSSTELWPTVQNALFQSLEDIYPDAGPWDLVIFTGDFVGRGDRQADFDVARVFLQALCTKLQQLGSDPKLVAVPGNHDLARPPDYDPATAVMQHLWGKELWDNRSIADVLFDKQQAMPAYRDVVVGAFENYCRWLRDPGMEVLKPTTSGLLPGDFSATYETNGVRLGLLGLNTAFLQLSDRSREGDLAVDARQIQEACAGDVPAWAAKHDLCLLLTHHPPAWLRTDARRTLMEEVLQLPKSSFEMQLCGHMHDPNMSFDQLGGGDPTRLLLGASLFGREFAGPDKDKRIHGYSACQLDMDREEIRVWPLTAYRNPLRLLPDYNGTKSTKSSFSWKIREGVTSTATGQSAVPTELEAVLTRKLTIYKRNLRYRFVVLEVTDRTMLVDLELSYELVNAANEPQVYTVGLPLERRTEYLEARYGNPEIDLNLFRYVKGDHIEFPVQLPVGDPVPVSMKARVTYGVPDSEGLATYIPSLDYELELTRRPELRLTARWLAAQQGECTPLSDNRERYKATEPLLQNQGMLLSWRLSAEST